MEQFEVVSYRGRNQTEEYVGIIQTSDLFVVLTFPAEIDSVKAEEMKRIMEADIQGVTFNHLAEFENFFATEFQKIAVPLHASISAGYLKGNVLYLKTNHEGSVYIYRDAVFTKLISGTSSASGYIKQGDRIIFTTNAINRICTEKQLEDIVSVGMDKMEGEISKYAEERNDAGIGLIIFSLSVKEMSEYNQVIIPEKKSFKTPAFISNLYHDLQLRTEVAGRKKTITFIVMIIMAIVFIWSVGFGFQRRKAAQETKRVQEAREHVTLELNQAQEVAFLNMPQAMSYISNAKTIVSDLEKQVSSSKKQDISNLRSFISEKEQTITKKEEKNYDEFYDLALDEKNAIGDQMVFSDGSVAILDKKNKNVYILSLKEKSLEKKTGSILSQADIVDFFQGDVFIVSQKNGIYKYDQNQFKKVIDPDHDWGILRAIKIYNSNIYLVDSGKNDIYKYLVVDTGYSQKSSYFASGEAPDMGRVNSVAIDSSVYLSFPDHISKFVGGVRDAFTTDYPDSDISISKVVAVKDDDNVYALDKEHGNLYVLTKKGEYLRQIKSSILSKAIDFVVFENKAYILVGSKLYTIGL